MKKIISLTLALITVLTLTVSTLATAVTAQAVSDVSDSMDYICFSAVRYMGIKVKYRPTASSSVKTFESKYADGSDQNFCGFIGRSVDKSYKYTNNEKLGAFNYYYGICTEEHLNQSGGVEVGSSADGVQDSIKYERSDEVFNVSYDDGKTLPADWVFKCFYYANQIAVEQGYDITELEKGYWTGDKDKDLSTLGTYNSDVEKGTLSHLNATSDLGFAIQTSAKRVFSFLFTEKSDGSLTYNDSVVIESATCLRGHKNVDAWREESADIKHLIELCGEITKRAIEDEDGISDKLFRIEGKGAWAMTNPNSETKSYLKFYIPVESKYLEDFQRMAVFSTEYTMPDDYEKGQIVVQKKDTNGNALKGAEFTIYDLNGNIPNALKATNGKLITDENGYAATEKEALDYGIYNVVETKFPDGYTKADGQPTSWRIEISSDTELIQTIYATNETDYTTLEGEKTWNDDNDRDGKRPESITVRLYADGVEIANKTVTENDDWKYKFENLPIMNGNSKIRYTITEDAVEGYTTEYNGNDIINTHVIEKTHKTVIKIWDDDNDRDGKRPDSVTIRLIADNVEIDSAVLTESGEWKHTFTDLPIYRDGGELIKYTIKEDPVTDYDTEINGDTVTNIHKTEKTFVTGFKTWNDDNDRDGVRPDSITIRLIADDVEIASKTVTERDQWTYTFSDLPKYKDGGKEIKYEIKEDPIKDYTTTYDGFNTINTHKITVSGVKGTKTWEDDNDRDGIRPASITIRLYADGVEIASKKVTETDEWTYTFENLPKYKDGGELIEYTISEDAVEGYTTRYEGFNTINTHSIFLEGISGTKTWEDDNDRDGIRPASITIRLYADGVEIASKKVTETDDWTYTFENLPKYKDGGELIEYTISEDAVEGYTTRYEGFNTINTHSIFLEGISGTKTWEDDNDRDGKRPDSITIRLYADGVEIESAVITEADEWKYSFEDLPKYRDGGTAIEYTITEDHVEGYTTTYNGFDIINTYATEVTFKKVFKVWDDDNDRDGVRPDSITIRLIADDVEIDSAVITEADEWTYTFENLPKYRDGGTEIVYTITEDPVADYDTEINGDTVTNKHVTEKTFKKVFKVWEDDNDRDGVRPDSITIRLIADNVEIDSAVITEADEWTYTFTDLPVYRDGGELIEYTIKEDAVDGYTTSIDGDTVTNKHVTEITHKTVVKHWDDNDNEHGFRPDSITIRLYADGVEIESAVITEADGWTYTFEDLPKYKDGGTEIEYTISEDAVDGYASMIAGYDVYNTLTVTPPDTGEEYGIITCVFLATIALAGIVICRKVKC